MKYTGAKESAAERSIYGAETNTTVVKGGSDEVVSYSACTL